jgi:hypothetical protein
LAGIEENGLELVRLIEEQIRVDGPKIAFVCHSRGGLVARSAACELFHRNPSWKDRIVGCVTFGTPHEGASLAEAPDALIASFVILGTLAETRQPLSILEILELLIRRTKIPGIEELRPLRGDGEFLKKLLGREAEARKEGCALDIFAVGGKAAVRGVKEWIADHAIGGRESDLVVETSSSISRFLPEGHTRPTHCNHFDYFSAEQVGKDHFREGVKYAQDRLGFSELRAEHLEHLERETRDRERLARVSRQRRRWPRGL